MLSYKKKDFMFIHVSQMWLVINFCYVATVGL